MPIIADYKSIKDGSFELSKGEEQTFSFEIPNDFSSGACNLMFKIRTIGVPPSPPTPGIQGAGTFDVDINDTVIINNLRITNAQNFFGYWEMFNGEYLRSGSNTVQFRALDGPIRFSDVTLFFQRQI